MRFQNTLPYRSACLILGFMAILAAPLSAQDELEAIVAQLTAEAAQQDPLDAVGPRILASLQNSVVRVVETDSDSEVQLAAADWLLSVTNKVAEALEKEDREEALQESWIILRQAEASLQTPMAEEKFGDSRLLLIKGCQDGRSQIVGFARLNLSRDQFQEVRTMTIEEERRRRAEDPDHGSFFGFGTHIESEVAYSALGEIAEASGRAFRAVPGSGLAEGAARQTFGLIGGATRLPGLAVGGVTEGMGVATGGLGGIEHFSVTLRQLPTDVRENAEQILADENYKTTLQSVDGLSVSIKEVAQAVDKLPEEVRETMGKFEETQPELRETIKEADVAIKSVEMVLAQAERASQALESTIRAAGETAEIGLRFIPEPKDKPEEPVEPKEPFRMESVTEAAEALEGTIAELRATLLALHDLVKEPQIPVLASTAAEESKGIVDHGAATSQSLVDFVLLRLFLFLAASLILLLIFQVARILIKRNLGAERTRPDVATANH